MKKFIATALAAGALAAGGAAQAQDVGSIISNLFFGGQQQYSQGQMYQDQYGRQFYYDQYGRQVYIQNQQQQIVGYDQWGRPLYNNAGAVYTNPNLYGQNAYPYGNYAYGNNNWDRDGDGIPNNRDRWPDDRRYY